MGYYTRYEFTTIDAPSDDEFHSVLNRVAGGKISEDGPCKWYEHEKNISAAMVESGCAAVDLHGVGEEQGDVWDKEFRLDPVLKKVTVKTFKYRLVRDKEPSR